MVIQPGAIVYIARHRRVAQILRDASDESGPQWACDDGWIYPPDAFAPADEAPLAIIAAHMDRAIRDALDAADPAVEALTRPHR
jgi:hypothetical protein